MVGTRKVRRVEGEVAGLVQDRGELVMRAYTPTSSDDDLGHFDLIVKIYYANQHKDFPEACWHVLECGLYTSAWRIVHYSLTTSNTSISHYVLAHVQPHTCQ